MRRPLLALPPLLLALAAPARTQELATLLERARASHAWPAAEAAWAFGAGGGGGR